MKIGENIKKIRTHKNMTQEEVAKKLNISPQAYAKIESGDTKLDIKRFQEIADILEIPLEDIHKLIDGSMNIVVRNNGNQQIGKHSTFHQESDKTNELLEKIITEQKEEIRFLREQIGVLNQLLQKNV
jgi:transcriptional regulator with XRE-family HTH domain